MAALKHTLILSGLALLSKVSAHGIVTGIVADGVYYQGYDPSFQYQHPPPTVAGWSVPEDQDRGFVSDYTSPDIICHKSATPGGSYVTVAAGNAVELQWTQWPESHHGPMIDYLAHCSNDDCTAVDKTTLMWNKIDEAGLIDGAAQKWASDEMIANNNTWSTTIPSSIAPGKYVLRHETIALHSANLANGAQNYPQCINLEITGSGSDSLPSGTAGTSLYTSTDPGIFINIYYPVLTSYDIPGPELYSGAGGNTQPSVSASATSSASSGMPTYTNATTVASATRPAGTGPAPTKSGISITADPTTGIAVPTGSATQVESSSAVLPTYTPPAESSPVEATTSTSPVSFTSTFTGRIGKPTKFTCYIEE